MSSLPYQSLCTEFYEIDKPYAPKEGIEWYLKYAEEAKGTILEPMCGTGRFLIPLAEKGYSITGFDCSLDMLKVCQKKCSIFNLNPELVKASFESFSLEKNYNLIIIPSSSFGLLVDPLQVLFALKFIYKKLNKNGKFVFEIETLEAIDKTPNIWKAKWVEKKDGSKIILNTVSEFNALENIQTFLCRYELWGNNTILKTEVEDFKIKLYAPLEIENLLEKQSFKILNKWQAEPYLKVYPLPTTSNILYECIKE